MAFDVSLPVRFNRSKKVPVKQHGMTKKSVEKVNILATFRGLLPGEWRGNFASFCVSCFFLLLGVSFLFELSLSEREKKFFSRKEYTQTEGEKGLAHLYQEVDGRKKGGKCSQRS